MSTKAELNDPLDSTFTVNLESYLKLYFERHPPFEEDEKELKLLRHVFQWKLEKFNNEWINDIDESYSKFRLTCFTEDGNNPLMWSHYASNHTGVCLKFDTDKDENLKKSLFPVEYKNELINANSLEDLRKCLLTKLETWKIEKEWRIIAENERFDFKQEALVEILFGLKVPDKTINWFKSFSENVYYMHAPIYRLKLLGNKLVKVDEYGEVVSYLS
jgi:hypothetical protein